MTLTARCLFTKCGWVESVPSDQPTNTANYALWRAAERHHYGTGHDITIANESETTEMTIDEAVAILTDES